MMEMEILYKETGSTENVTLALIADAKSLVIDNPADYEKAGLLKKELNANLKRWVDEYEELLNPTKAAYDKVREKKKIVCKPYEDAIDDINRKLSAYATRLADARRVEQTRLEAQARAAAEVERQKLLERAVSAKTESKQEELLERAGNVYVKPVIAAREIEKMVKTEDLKMVQREDIEIILVDMKLFCAEIAAGRAPITAVKPCIEKTKAWVKAMGIKQCPGLVIREKTIVI